MAVQPGLCQTWSETPKTGFLTKRLMSYMVCEFMYSTISRHVGSLVRVILDVVDESFQGFGSLKRQGNTVKPVLRSHLKIDKMKGLKVIYRGSLNSFLVLYAS